MGEKLLEKKLRMKVKAQGGRTYKFASPGTRGVTDRIVVRRAGKVSFVEVKSEGQKPDPLQKIFIRDLKKLGCRVYVIDSQEALDNFLKIPEMTYTDRIGENGLYTRQGDKIGEIYDEALRSDALMGLNGEYPEDVQGLVGTVDHLKLDYDDAADMIRTMNRLCLDAEALPDLLEDREILERVRYRLEEIQAKIDRIAAQTLLDALGEDHYEALAAIIDSLETIEQAEDPKPIVAQPKRLKKTKK